MYIQLSDHLEKNFFCSVHAILLMGGTLIVLRLKIIINLMYIELIKLTQICVFSNESMLSDYVVS